MYARVKETEKINLCRGFKPRSVFQFGKYSILNFGIFTVRDTAVIALAEMSG